MTQDAAPALESAREVLSWELPDPIARLMLTILAKLPDLPLDEPERKEITGTGLTFRETQLPAWMPPSRIIGGFYVTRPIGTGTGGTVFVARRIEDRHDELAEHFALKVPDYSGAAARTLSEEQFLQMFREEAGALLAIPQHPNLARFVTFDVGARPKPILVMELVEGPQLERLLQMGDLGTARAFEILDGIADGLHTMHQAGVGHLDLKPSNVIVRDPDGLTGPLPPGTPVLVDFGLAGRNVRPGCGTAEYGAPEVWDPNVAPGRPHPAATDVYAFGCLIYELLVGIPIFDGEHELEIIPLHHRHDGVPEPLAELARDPRFGDLAKVIRATLRRDPEKRCSVEQARRALQKIGPTLASLPWPIID